MCVFLISPVPIAEPLTSELINTPVLYNLAQRPIKYRLSVPIPNFNSNLIRFILYLHVKSEAAIISLLTERAAPYAH